MKYFIISRVIITLLFTLTVNNLYTKEYRLLSDKDYNIDIHLYLFGYVNNCVICELSIEQVNSELKKYYKTKNIFIVNTNINFTNQLPQDSDWEYFIDPIGFYSSYYDVTYYPYYKLFDNNGNLILEGKAGGKYNSNEILDSVNKFFINRTKIKNLKLINNIDFTSRFDLKFDYNGNIYILKEKDNRLVKFSKDSNIVEYKSLKFNDVIGYHYFKILDDKNVFILNTFNSHFEFFTENNSKIIRSKSIETIAQNLNNYISKHFYFNTNNNSFYFNTFELNDNSIISKNIKFYYDFDRIDLVIKDTIDLIDSVDFIRNNSVFYQYKENFVIFNLYNKILKFKNNEIEIESYQKEIAEIDIHKNCSHKTFLEKEKCFQYKIRKIEFIENNNELFLYFEYYENDSLDKYDFNIKFKLFKYNRKSNLLNLFFESNENQILLNYSNNIIKMLELNGENIYLLNKLKDF